MKTYLSVALAITAFALLFLVFFPTDSHKPTDDSWFNLAGNYRFVYDVHSSINFSEFPILGGQNNNGTLLAKGNLSFNPLKQNSYHATFSLSFFKWNSSLTAQESVDIRKDFLEGVVLEYTHNKFPTKTLEPQQNKRIISRFYRSFFDSLTLNKENLRDEGAWEATEKDSFGLYTARYHLSRKEDSLLLVKSKLSYMDKSRFVKRQSGPINNRIVKSKTSWKWEGGSLQEVSLAEKIEIYVNDQKVGSYTRNLSLVPSSPPPRPGSASKSGTQKNHKPIVPPEEDIDRLMAQNKLQGKSFSDIMDMLASHNVNTTEIFVLLKSFFTLYPENTSLALQIILNSSLTSPGYQAVVPALQIVGHSQAQETLRSAILATQQDKQLDLLATLSFLEEPSDSTLELLLDFSQGGPGERASLSELALGGAILEARRTQSAATRDLEEIIIERALRANSTSSLTHSLRVLGNAGTSPPTEWLEKQLTSASPQVRQSAMQSLRFVENRQATVRLYKALQADASPEVRKSAADALSYRVIPSTDVPLIKEVIRAEKNKSVRLQLYALLVNHFKKSELAYLRRRAKAETSKDIREYLTSEIALF